MMVNGNIGTGVAVAGAFNLVRFRSVPGNARDIVSIFFAMAVGLATGMGYLFYALLFLVIIGVVNVALLCSRFGDGKANVRTLKITVPENLDYEGLFDDLLQQYATSYTLEKVRTTNMGSLFELSYTVRLKGDMPPKGVSGCAALPQREPEYRSQPAAYRERRTVRRILCAINSGAGFSACFVLAAFLAGCAQDAAEAQPVGANRGGRLRLCGRGPGCELG